MSALARANAKKGTRDAGTNHRPTRADIDAANAALRKDVHEWMRIHLGASAADLDLEALGNLFEKHRPKPSAP